MNKVVSSGTVSQGGLSIQSPASSDSDGFTVLPDGNFLINDHDASPTYREYSATTGSLVSGGKVINLTPYIPPQGNGPAATGVTLAPDGTLYFVAGFVGEDISSTTLIHWDLTQGELGEQSIEINGLADAIEDIDVVIP